MRFFNYRFAHAPESESNGCVLPSGRKGVRGPKEDGAVAGLGSSGRELEGDSSCSGAAGGTGAADDVFQSQ